MTKYKVGKAFNEVVMIEISEKEEEELDNIEKRILSFERGSRTFNINTNQVICYGNVDFEDEETIDHIHNFKFLQHLGGIGVKMPSKYDYKSHTCLSDVNYVTYTETWNPLKLMQYAYGCLNKPKRLLLFMQN